jgi:hypothetical protein
MENNITVPKFELNAQNYYTPEADREYISCSQYDAFESCEAAALAQLQGRHERETSKAFVVGNYFHTAMESEDAHAEFCEAHANEIFKKNGGKYADFEQADLMIETAHKDPEIRKLIDMPGQNEIIMTGNLFDEFPFKVRFDKYADLGNGIRTIIDWKTTADIWKSEYNPEEGGRVSFIRNFGYIRRAAVYLEIEKQNADKETDAAFFIVAISKQNPPDKEIILMNQRQELDLALEQMYGDLTRIQQIKQGLKKPTRCGHCAYCRGTKKITEIRQMWQLDPGNYPPREDEYDELLAEV